MPRIEIELTSARPDGTWTWRAAGAKQPKGMLDGSVLPGGAKVGDVLRADADIDIDGITVRSAQPVVQKKSESERIEIVGSGREEPPVITNMRGGLEAGGERERGRRGDRDRDGDRGRGPGGPGGPGRGPGGPGRPGGPGGAGGFSRPGGPRADQSRRPEGAGGARPGERRGERPGGPGRPAGDRPAGDRSAGDRSGGERPGGERPGGERPGGERTAGDRPGGERPAGDRPGRDRPSGDRPGGGRPAGDRPTTGRPGGTRPGGDRPPGDRPPRDRQPSDRPRSDRQPGDRPPSDRHPSDRPASDRPPGERRERPARPPRVAEPPRPKAKRLQPGRAFRDAVLAELSPERKAVAEQILRGGIPAVRQAVEEQNAQAREVAGPEIKVDALLAVAEELLPALRAAEWRDRADAAIGIVDEISVRDLRAVVSGADTARDEEGRALAAQLRDALDRRAASERQSWVDEISSSLDDGRIVRALRISGRPPEPGVRFPADLAKRLSDAAGDALSPDATPDRWAAVLEAVVASPARRTITPKGLPAEPGEALTKALRQAAARVPAIATLLGEPAGAPPRRPPKPTGPRAVSDPTRPPGRPTTPPPPPPSRPGAAAVGSPSSPTSDSPAAEPAIPAVAGGEDTASAAEPAASPPAPPAETMADATGGSAAEVEVDVATPAAMGDADRTELEPGPPLADLVDDQAGAAIDTEPAPAAPDAEPAASDGGSDESAPAAPGIDDLASPVPPTPEPGAEPPGAQVEVAPDRGEGAIGNGVPAENATVAPD